MLRSIISYGLIAGLIVVAGIGGLVTLFGGDRMHVPEWLGYLTMLVALSAILVGVKRYRDQALGGVIRFWPAFGMGLGIAVIAGLIYVGAWEVYFQFGHPDFMDRYIQETLAAKRAAGLSGAAYDQLAAQMEPVRQGYKNPLFRLAVTFSEVFPVGAVVALASAALLRNPRFLPARSRPV